MPHLILKVVDASDEDYERQLEAVDRVLDGSRRWRAPNADRIQ